MGNEVKKIAIFASGSGTNAENIIRYFQSKKTAEVVLVLCNKADAGVLKRAADLGVDSYVFNREEFYRSGQVLEMLTKSGADLVVLAGFLWLIPEELIAQYPNKIINIHPALLPKYGGKGMYGMNVHKAVHEAEEEETGITIHLVNEEYDKGEILFQARTKLQGESPEEIAAKIHELEYAHFPQVIEEYLNRI